MEASIRRIERLETVIKAMKSAHNDCMKAVGESVLVKAYRLDDGSQASEQKIVSVKNISGYVNNIADKETR